jgi:hypothetical protein
VSTIGCLSLFAIFNEQGRKVATYTLAVYHTLLCYALFTAWKSGGPIIAPRTGLEPFIENLGINPRDLKAVSGVALHAVLAVWLMKSQARKKLPAKKN